jgi:RHS repeat-associated protein
LGQPETDIQSLPFGDQLNSYPDQYAPATADDSAPLYFTGKERDAESGLDYFPMRYYGSAMGRWMSPDPLGGNVANPQSLNRYQYVFNNPLRFTDSTGLEVDPSATQGWLLALLKKIGHFFSGGGGGGGGCTGTCLAAGPNLPMNPHSTHTFSFQLPVVHAQAVEPETRESKDDLEGGAEGEDSGLEPLGPGEVVVPEPWSYMNPGPLGEGNAARAFAGGRYWKYTVPQGGMGSPVFRVWSKPGTENGPWYSPFPQAGGYQSIIDNALRPEWGNSAQNVTAVDLPAGTVTYWGFSAYQGDFYLGGNIQIYVPQQ